MCFDSQQELAKEIDLPVSGTKNLVKSREKGRFILAPDPWGFQYKCVWPHDLGRASCVEE